MEVTPPPPPVKYWALEHWNELLREAVEATRPGAVSDCGPMLHAAGLTRTSKSHTPQDLTAIVSEGHPSLEGVAQVGKTATLLGCWTAQGCHMDKGDRRKAGCSPAGVHALRKVTGPNSEARFLLLQPPTARTPAGCWLQQKTAVMTPDVRWLLVEVQRDLSLPYYQKGHEEGKAGLLEALRAVVSHPSVPAVRAFARPHA